MNQLWFYASLVAACFFYSKKIETPLLSNTATQATGAFTHKPDAPETLDFNKHIKPILADRCFKCHGPDKNKVEAGLQLTSFETATAVLKSKKRAIVPFKPNESELVRRILTKDPDDVMPTPSSNLSLTEEEKKMLIKWIEQGAEYKPHWAFVPPSPEVPPSVKNTFWARNAIDFFILNPLEYKNIKPNSEAPKETLIRRLSLDLTGLPPTIQEINDFINDKSEKAYERLVDRLLASPHYGERMALDWLDVARYADSHGYQDDGLRNAYPYRDWVIRAFNQNLPFDQFVKWQLAGDLLKNPTKDQLIATCFNRNHQQTQEGGVVDEEYRSEYVADRVNTFGKAFLGLTLECARCHTHKYDPIEHKEYYQLYAFFNQNNDTGIVPYSGEATPTLILTTPEAEQSLDSIKRLIPDRLAKATVSEAYKSDFKRWLSSMQIQSAAGGAEYLAQPVKRVVHLDFEKEDTTLVWDNVFPPTQETLEKRAKAIEEAKKDTSKKITPPEEIPGYWNLEKSDTALKAAGYSGDKDKRPVSTEGYRGKGLFFKGDAGFQMGRALDYDRYQPFTVSIWFKLLKKGEHGPIFNKSNGDFEGYRGWLCKLNKDGTLSFQLNHVWPDNSIDIQTFDTIKVGEWTHIALTYDGSSRAEGVRFWVNGRVPQYEVLTDNLKKSILHTRKKGNWSSTPFMIGMETRESIQNVAMDELQIFKRQLAEIEIQELYSNKSLILDLIQKKNRSESEDRQLLEAYLLRGYNPIFNEHLDSLWSLRKAENAIITEQEEVMIMTDRKHPRKSFVLDRGAYDAPKAEVTAGTPAQLLPFDDKKYPTNRLGLAEWLLDERNPLFARVMVNRYWQLLFGKGLVNTQEDFGNQGAIPTHPELLDWLALDFRAKGWDLKQFIKQIVLSATYRQSSIPSAQATEKDFMNDLYSRFPAHRLSAEIIRDNALAASDLLVRKIGGPSVYPYQPAGIWEALSTRNATVYVQNHGDSLYRRSLYTIWKRSAPPPAMLNFDATDRATCMVRRQKTASPLQALVLMNDPQFVEAARVLSERVSKTTPTDFIGTDSVEGNIKNIFTRLTSRSPRGDELSVLLKLYNQEVQFFKQNPEKANELLSVGEYPSDKTADAATVAAYTVVVSTIMNFDEFVMKR